MAPNRETQMGTYTKIDHPNKAANRPPKLSMESLQRTISDISFELISKETAATECSNHLPPISEVEDAKCECCGMSEECTPEYIKRVRERFSGKLVCGLCAEAVNQEMEKNGGKREEALKEHMNVCVRFNRIGRAYPVLYQAEAVREIFKKSSIIRAKSISPKDWVGGGVGTHQRKGSLTRSSSCIPAITKDISTDQRGHIGN